MNSAQIHLALNHFPIAGIIFSFLFASWGIVVKKDEIKMAAVLLALAASISGAIMMASGEGAEEVVEHKTGVTKSMIHEHEEAAEASMIFIHLSTILGITWFIMNRINKNHKDKVFLSMILTTIIASALIARAAHEGGKIRHDEIRGDQIILENKGEGLNTNHESSETYEEEKKENDEK